MIEMIWCQSKTGMLKYGKRGSAGKYPVRSTKAEEQLARRCAYRGFEAAGK